MKKLLSLSFVCILLLGLLSGCGCAKQDATNPPATQSGQVTEEEGTPSTEKEAQNEETPQNLPAVSENKEVAKENQAPKVFILQNSGNDTDNLTYHLENCPLLEGKEAQEMSWEVVQMIGYWQCPTCNPPRYENYTNAE